MGVFCEEVVDQARKGAARDGKRCEFFSRNGAKTQRRAEVFVAPLCRCERKLLPFVLIEEDLEVAAHVGFVEGVFGGGRFPRGRAGVGLRQ